MTSADTKTRAPTGDASSIYAARALRDFGDGFTAVLLPVWLTSLGLDAFQIGVAATLALAGSAAVTLGIGMLGARFDHRLMLMCAAGVMIATGLMFANASAYPVILLVSFVGTINPSAGSASIFAPLEQSVLAGAIDSSRRTSAFARYSLIGALAAATGALASGSPDLLAKAGLDRMDALRAMFALYAALGLAAALIYARLPAAPRGVERPKSALGPSRAIVYKLAALFSVDSFAGGFAVQSLIALWLFEKFDLSLATAGLFFFWSGVATAFSFPVAAWLSARIGLVNTMVWTHIPASLCLIAAAVTPDLYVTMALLLLRAALSQMDVPARTSYVMAVVTPPERAAAASFTAVPRSLASAISPSIAGALFVAGHAAWPLVLCGALKIAYDLALLWTFRNVKPPEEL